jgi:exosortase
MRRQRWPVALTAAAILVCYAPTLRGMIDQWWTDEDMGHGFFVPLVIAWIVWRGRAVWNSLPMAPSRWGLLLLAGAACLHITGVLGGGLFVGSVALLLSIAGAIVCLGGFAWLRLWAFPLLLALFMLPKLAIVYNQATLPLQLLASRMAAAMLTGTGAAVIRDGNILQLGGHQILVAEACSGIRYLLPLGFMAVLFGYLFDSRPWIRLVLLAAAVPIAIVANSVRVAAAGALPSLAEGTPHALSGWFIFLLCMISLILVQRLFRKPGHPSYAKP